ncbi:hypothetical protein GW17_00011182 [Ensete ventricosum]|nr:hypothetical protein GW17_00011182 [Ensete ventricosum]
MDRPSLGGATALLLLLLAAGVVAASSSSSPSSKASTESDASVATLATASSGGQINSNSVLVALLDSHYTELAELVEKALLLPSLEAAVGRHNLTIFAPRNDALERDLDPEFKRFLLEPRNLRSLQTLLLYHVVPARIPSDAWPQYPHPTLAGDHLHLSSSSSDGSTAGGEKKVGHAAVLYPDAVPRGHLRRAPHRRAGGGPPYPPPQEAGAARPARRPSRASDLRRHGNEFADILVNLTSMATEMGRLVSEGYVLTVLAPNDDAMARLTADQLSEPGAPEAIMYFHLIPEYQTEESMYNAVRRFGKVRYDTLRVPHNVVAREADGSVKFGAGEGSAYLFDPDIYTDGRISVQGIDAVLFPPDEDAPLASPLSPAARKAELAQVKGKAKLKAKLRRGNNYSSFILFVLQNINFSCLMTVIITITTTITVH